MREGGRGREAREEGGRRGGEREEEGERGRGGEKYSSHYNFLRWSTLMKKITDAATIVSDLVSGSEYVFRVIAGNHVGSSVPSLESDPVRLSRTSTQFSLEPFTDHFTLSDVIARSALDYGLY